MKSLKWTAAAAALSIIWSGPAFAESNYSVFRVCEDKHVFRTSDGAEAGHVDYIVVDPQQRRIVSAVVTGGVLENRHVAIPFDDVDIGSSREITLRRINRETLVSAPVIEEQRLTQIDRFEPQIVERSAAHFRSGASVQSSRSESAGSRNIGGQGGNPKQSAKERDRSQTEATTGAAQGSPEPVGERIGKSHQSKHRDRSETRSKEGASATPGEGLSTSPTPGTRSRTSPSPGHPGVESNPGSSPSAATSPSRDLGTRSIDQSKRSPLEGQSTPPAIGSSPPEHSSKAGSSPAAGTRSHERKTHMPEANENRHRGSSEATSSPSGSESKSEKSRSDQD